MVRSANKPFLSHARRTNPCGLSPESPGSSKRRRRRCAVFSPWDSRFSLPPMYLQHRKNGCWRRTPLAQLVQQNPPIARPTPPALNRQTICWTKRTLETRRSGRYPTTVRSSGPVARASRRRTALQQPAARTNNFHDILVHYLKLVLVRNAI